jgi:hypothetical protein
MATMTKNETVTGVNVRELAGAINEEIEAIYAANIRTFPYNKERLRNDIGLILLYDMADSIKVEFYDNEQTERVSYAFVPGADPAAAITPPGQFPRRDIPANLNVRITAYDTTKKPEGKVREFYEQLGWRRVESLRRSGQGTTETYGSFKSGGIVANRSCYTDLPGKKTEGKGVAL